MSRAEYMAWYRKTEAGRLSIAKGKRKYNASAHGREKNAEWRKQYRANNPLAYKAHNAVTVAIAMGKMES